MMAALFSCPVTLLSRASARIKYAKAPQLWWLIGAGWRGEWMAGAPSLWSPAPGTFYLHCAICLKFVSVDSLRPIVCDLLLVGCTNIASGWLSSVPLLGESPFRLLPPRPEARNGGG